MKYLVLINIVYLLIINKNFPHDSDSRMQAENFDNTTNMLTAWWHLILHRRDAVNIMT